MKVLIAADGPTLDSAVAKRFGHAECYLLIDTATLDLQVVANGEPHDDSHAIIRQLAGQGVELFVTGNIGPHAFELIQAHAGQVALARRMSAGEALAKLAKNKLELLDAPTVKHSQHDHTHHSA